MNGTEFRRLIVEARKKRGLSQAAACQLIGIAEPSTLSKWENGAIIPSDDMVVKLVEAYEDPIIGYMYLKECTQLGKMLLPDIVLSDLDNLTLRFQKEYNDILGVRTDMISIACDNVVHEWEEERWLEVKQEIAELASVSLPLVIRNFIKNKKPLQGGSLVRATK